MLGFVRKVALLSEQKRANALESKLLASQLELAEANKELSSTKHLRSVELNSINTQLSESKSHLRDLKALANKSKDEAQNAANKLIQKAETLSNEIKQAAIAEAEVIKQDAEREKKEIIRLAVTAAEEASEQLKAELSILASQEEALLKKLSTLEKKLSSSKVAFEHKTVAETITSYKYLVDGPVSEKIKSKLEKVKKQQKALILKGKAYKITNEIRWNNNLASGKAMQKRHAKFLLTAFNAEVDNIITQTTSRNFAVNTKKIEKWFEQVNKNGDDSYIVLSRDLLSLRLEEQRYFFEHKYKKDMELEEQRFMRQTLREEAKVKKEIEKFVSEREKEERAYQKDLNKALLDIKSANQEQVSTLTKYIEELQLKLSVATKEKERALSMAQLTRSGYVYIISNRGSFGKDIYKIGMTRRLEPLDRVKELSGASVPFYYDVHALIPSDDAPSLETQLHNRFAAQRVNKINQRREFFRLQPFEIDDAIHELVEDEVNIIHDVVSDQYEETMLIEEELNE
ncbi:DUF4041 domain-containing protein [Alteromonas sp. A081]|uniref:GIY-YIG nuclease family protein n=1 Tax=Alteromonas sp. A081 TaxID=3410269 RepID=UPI003B986A65